MARTKRNHKRDQKWRLGTYPHKDGRFGARIAVNGSRLHLGLWQTERAAGLAYDRAVLHFRLERPLNFPKASINLGPASPTELRSQAILIAKRRSKKRSPYIGVTWCHQNERWQARATIDGKPDRHVGYFDTAATAARARDRIAYGELGTEAVLNFPNEVVRRKRRFTYGQTPSRKTPTVRRKRRTKTKP